MKSYNTKFDEILLLFFCCGCVDSQEKVKPKIDCFGKYYDWINKLDSLSRFVISWDCYQSDSGDDCHLQQMTFCPHKYGQRLYSYMACKDFWTVNKNIDLREGTVRLGINDEAKMI